MARTLLQMRLWRAVRRGSAKQGARAWTRRFSASLVWLGASLLTSCSASSSRPPFAKQGVDLPDASAHEEPPFVTLPPISDSPCQTTVELQVVRPSFYVMLDASASMLAPMPGNQHHSRYESALRAISTMLRGVQTRVNFGAAVFPSPSTENSCAAGGEVFEVRAGDGEGTDEPGLALQSLMYRLKRVSPNGGTPISTTLAALNERLAALPKPAFLFLLTDGAPNCNLAKPCDATGCILNLDGAAFDNGLACDATFNCCSDALFPHMCLDDDATIQQLEALSQAGVAAYVIGMPGSSTYATVLDRMAEAAGTARDDSERRYYQVEDADQLVTTLTELSSRVLVDCSVVLHAPPRDRSLVSVQAGERDVAASDWQWLDEQTVELLGQTCDLWQAGELPLIRVTEQCTSPVR